MPPPTLDFIGTVTFDVAGRPDQVAGAERGMQRLGSGRCGAAAASARYRRSRAQIARTS